MLCKSGSWKWNIKEETISLSDGWKRMLGFTSEEIKDHISEWIERLHPNDKFKTLKILTSLKRMQTNILIFTTGLKTNPVHIAG